MNIAKKVCESSLVSSYEHNKKQSKKYSQTKYDQLFHRLDLNKLISEPTLGMQRPLISPVAQAQGRVETASASLTRMTHWPGCDPV